MKKTINSCFNPKFKMSNDGQMKSDTTNALDDDFSNMCFNSSSSNEFLKEEIILYMAKERLTKHNKLMRLKPIPNFETRR